jgi:hypothetical protein
MSANTGRVKFTFPVPNLLVSKLVSPGRRTEKCCWISHPRWTWFVWNVGSYLQSTWGYIQITTVENEHIKKYAMITLVICHCDSFIKWKWGFKSIHVPCSETSHHIQSSNSAMICYNNIPTYGNPHTCFDLFLPYSGRYSTKKIQ